MYLEGFRLVGLQIYWAERDVRMCPRKSYKEQEATVGLDIILASVYLPSFEGSI